jgi:hypothetical protein
MARSGASRPLFLRTWLIWTAGFPRLPHRRVRRHRGGRPRGQSRRGAAGRRAITGLVIGADQAQASSRRLDLRGWIPATTIGMNLGLLLGAWVVGYRTSPAGLAGMGALSGLVLGVAQALALPRHAHLRWVWAAALPFLWAPGLDRHHTHPHPHTHGRGR